MNLRRLALLPACCAMAHAIAAAPQQPAMTVSIRIQPVNDAPTRAALWKEIEKVSGTTKLKVPKGQSVQDAMRRECGSAPDDLQKILLAKNKGVTFEPADVDRELEFIACPYWYFGEGGGKRPTVKVHKGEILDHVLRAYVGSAGPETIAEVRQMNPDLIGPRNEILKSGQLSVPYIVRSLHVPVPVSATQAQAIATTAPILRALPSKTKPIARQSVTFSASVYNLIVEQGAEPESEDDTCGGPEDDDALPYDASSVASAFASLKPKTATKPILIADTGLDVSESNLRKRPVLLKNLWNNDRPDGLPGALFSGDVHGASMVTRNGQIGPTPNYKFASHGTYVADIILEPAVRAQYPVFPKIAVAKLNDETSPFAIQLNAVPEALGYARAIEASTVNLSVAIGAAVGGLANGLRDPPYLVVAAAGNSRNYLDEVTIFPPSFDESLRGHLIVVGSHDWKKRLAYFSNRGGLVDILAPGCGIPVRTPRGFELVSGTSFSAPFVTLTAGLLGALRLSPEQIKTRITMSADYDPMLVSVVKNGSRLNIERAIRVTDDSITLRSGRVLFGQLDRDQTWTCKLKGGGERLLNPAQVYKIVPDFDLAGSPVFKVWRLAAGNASPVEMYCQGDVPEYVVFRASDDVTPTSYHWNTILDVVPALMPAPRVQAATTARSR